MAGFEREKHHFPLQKIEDVIDIFKCQLKEKDNVNLSLLSIILGTIENALTTNRTLSGTKNVDNTLEPIFPVIQWETIEALYTKFVTHVKSYVDLSQYPEKFPNRELVKKVSDVIWGNLMRGHYKDKAHLQSLYSFLTGNKMDCFGVAFAVVAAFQVLGYDDVHLALSEDHAWVVFGEDLKQSAEVTWHGKGNEDKRGQPITESVCAKHWLYLNGYGVVCTRQMEVAAIVSGINPSISATVDSVEMGSLQQELLWLLYDQGHLSKYPMALGNLGDCEEICETPGRPPPITLFHEAIESAKTNYDNHHVYPYTYLGGHYYRKGEYREAIQAWADASSVIKKYNYNRDDEEIYKEFIEIANTLIPNLVKVVTATSLSKHSSILFDTETYANFLRFYDGICEWEEDSPTPVLHTVWAKQLVYSLSKFDPRVRNCIQIHAEGEEEETSSDSDSSDSDKSDEGENKTEADTVKEKEWKGGRRKKRKPKKSLSETNGFQDEKAELSPKTNGSTEEDQIKTAIEELVSKVGEDSQSETPNPNIAELAQACSESILNRDYLLTGGEPFTTSATTTTSVITSTYEARVDVNEFLSSKSNGTQFPGMTVDSMLKAESPADMMMFRKQPDSAPAADEPHVGLSSAELKEEETENVKEAVEKEEEKFEPISAELNLYSQKMKGLRKLLSSEKLNTSAIMLQLTAQSQTHFKHNKRGSGIDMGYSLPRKRTRREIS